MPTSLHEDIARAAAAEDVSLNLFICTTLARAVQWEAREPPPREAGKRATTSSGIFGWSATVPGAGTTTPEMRESGE